MTDTPFADAAATYLQRGWSVFPLPVGKKSPPPSGLTGYDAHRVTEADVREWIEDGHGDGNLGVWAAPGLLGIDVDAYAKKGVTKTGDVTLAELEAQLGPLPSTWISSARELPSGIRWYRVPEDVLFITKLVGIEFIQPTHRYGVVPPSTNPDADGAAYRWWFNGRATKRIPAVTDLAELPDEWVEHITRTGKSRTTGVRAAVGGEDEARAWLAEHGAGEPCRAVRGVLRAHIATLDDGSSRYENAVAGQMALLHLAVEGHLGISWAMPQLKTAYLEAVAGENRDTEAEWRRALVTGIEKQITVGETIIPHPDGKCPDTQASFSDASLWPAPAAPRDVADRFTRELYTAESERTLCHWREDFYTWRGSHWRARTTAQLDAQLSEILAHASYLTAASSPTEAPWRPSPTKVKAVLGALASLVNRDDELDADDMTGLGITFANGVLDLDTRVLKPHTPAWFNLTALPYDYDPDAPEPVEWLKFLATLWPAGADEVDLLQEFMGYLISGRIDLHKMLVLIGPPRAGKGVITHVCTNLVGLDNHASTRVEHLASEFGLERAIGKSLITLGDARFTSKNARDAVETLLGIVGGDDVPVNRKNRPVWHGVLPGRFIIATNEPPALPDASSAMTTRMLNLIFTESFENSEDRYLLPRLLKELPGIFAWALAGYDRLVENELVFTLPESSRVVRREIENLGAPVRAFVEECCLFSPAVSVSKNDLYSAWQQWCVDHGRHALSFEVFFRDLYTAHTKLRKFRPRGGQGSRVQMVGGLGLRPDARSTGDLR